MLIAVCYGLDRHRGPDSCPRINESYLGLLARESLPDEEVEVTRLADDDEEGLDQASLHKFSTNDVIFDTLLAVLLII